MRSCWSLSVSIWFYSSLYLFFAGTVASFWSNDGIFMIPIWGFFIFSPLLMLHAGVIHTLRKLAYPKEDIQWITSLLGWVVYTIFIIQHFSDVVPILSPIVFVLGGCSSLAVLTTFREKEHSSIEESDLSLYAPQNKQKEEDILISKEREEDIPQNSVDVSFRERESTCS